MCSSWTLVWVEFSCVFQQVYHPLVGVWCVVGSVQQLAVLQLLAQPLQQVDGLIKGGGHGHPSQVFTCRKPPDSLRKQPAVKLKASGRQRVLAYVVVEDGHEAYVAVVRAGRRQRRPSACALRNITDWNSGNASTVLASNWNCNHHDREQYYWSHTSRQKIYCQSLSQKAKLPPCTHRVPPLAPSWWCFHRWVPIHRTLRRSYHTGDHHWHRNTLQLSLPQKEAPGMNYSQLKAERGGKDKIWAVEFQKRTRARGPRWQVGYRAYLGWLVAVANLPGFLQLLPLLGQSFVHGLQGSEHCWAGNGIVNIRLESEFPPLPFLWPRRETAQMSCWIFLLSEDSVVVGRDSWE